MSAKFTFEGPPQSRRRAGPADEIAEAADANPGRWLKFPGSFSSAHTLKKRGYEAVIRSKNLYVRKVAAPAKPEVLPDPPKRGHPTMRVSGLPSLADEMDRARIGTR